MNSNQEQNNYDNCCAKKNVDICDEEENNNVSLLFSIIRGFNEVKLKKMSKYINYDREKSEKTSKILC